MLQSYLKIAWRTLQSGKLYSLINIAGLATGMAVTLLIGFWIWSELSFNSYHQKRAGIARLMSTTTFNGNTSTGAGVAVPLANELQSKYPNDFKKLALATGNRSYVLTVGNKRISEYGRWVQTAFPEIFTFTMLKGTGGGLNDPSSILLAESTARTLFGAKDALNQTILLDNNTPLKVRGIYKDIPASASFAYTRFLASWMHPLNTNNKLIDDWNNHHSELYVELSDPENLDRINQKIKNITKPFIKGGTYEQVLVHPMNKWFLYQEFTDGKNTGGRIDVVRLFSVIGFFILLLACINFMNLSTARSEKRAKEVGIRKAVGSVRYQLIIQFLCESLVMVSVAGVISIVLVQISLPYFNTLADKQIVVPWGQPGFWAIMILFTLVTSLISGSYPAFYLSRFNPTKTLKGTFHAGPFASLPRKVLVVVQFAVSITLMIGMLIVFQQIQFARSRPVGYDRESLVSVSMNAPDIRSHYEALRADLIATGMVADMAASSSPATNVINHMLSFKWRGKNPDAVPLIGTIAVTHDFGKTIGWKMKEGRDFSREHVSDSGTLILNESAVRLTGFANPIGETMHWGGKDRMIVGVVRDMVMESPYTPVQPTVFFLDYTWRTHVFTVRLKASAASSSGLGKIRSSFQKYYPGNLFEFTFVGDQYDNKFHDEQKMSDLVTAFSLITILISCLGLFGLASFVAEQRTKEIGVRKVLGASVFNLWRLLATDFIALVIIAMLIAVPIGFYVMNQWLQKYEYRVDLPWWTFVVPGALALVVTMLTVSAQAIRAATVNPVQSLRAE